MNVELSQENLIKGLMQEIIALINTYEGAISSTSAIGALELIKVFYINQIFTQDD
tara:strand:+ start:359 stop:523 length:165 start_codon:yes stop_codon:yes gene_type:complete